MATDVYAHILHHPRRCVYIDTTKDSKHSPTQATMTTPTPANTQTASGAYIKKSKSDSWGTPSCIRDRYPLSEWHDPCPYNGVDGLTTQWEPRTFCNPPYGDLARWSAKVSEQAALGRHIVLLIPSRTDTAYFHRLISHAPRVEFIRGRLKFTDLDGSSAKPTSAPFPSLLLYFNEPR
jgi:hypothetical protein